MGLDIPQDRCTRGPAGEVGRDSYLTSTALCLSSYSPELHPAHPNTPDLSLYILDAQETYLRRSRASSPFPPHLRSAHASSPRVDADGSFPALGGASHQAQSMQEVWTGKGLVTWALDEPGDGKNLITGRLMKTRDFGHVVKGQDLSPLEEMMMADQEGDEESWGIEISLGLRSGSGGPVGAQLQVQQVKAVNAGKSDTFSRCSLASDTSISPAEGSGSQLPLQPDAPSRLEAQQPTLHAPVKVQTSHPLSPKRTVSTTPHVRAHEISKRHSSGKRKKTHHADPTRQSMVQSHSHPVDRKSTSKLRPMRTSSSQHMGGSDIRRQQLHNDSFPNDLPGQLYVKPDTLTPEQAQRLIESPAFLSMLEKLTGQPILAARGNKRALEQEGEESDPANKASDPAKKAKHEPPFKVPGIPSGSRAPPADPQTVLKCWNCGRTKSAVWRMKVMEDGKSVRVCNGRWPFDTETGHADVRSLRLVLEQAPPDAPSHTMGRR